MKNKPILIQTVKTSFAVIIISLLLVTNVGPIPVHATCIPGGGGVITCDDANDSVSGTDADADSSSATNTITGDGGSDAISGGDANGNSSEVTNTLSGGENADLVSGGNALGNTADVTNILNGDAGDDVIIGGSSWGGNSTVDNLILGGEGNDIILPGGDRGTVNIIDGGNGTDTLDYSIFSVGVTIDLGLSTPQHTGTDESTDTIASIENLTGTSLGDDLTGTSGDNVLIGNGGDDIIAGEGGKDTISGGEGSDTIFLSGELGTNNGPGENDPANAASVNGGSGANNILFAANTFGNVFLTSSSGLDTLDFSQYNAPITIDLSISTPQMVAVIPSGGDPSSPADADPVSPSELWVTLSGLFKNVFGSLNFTNIITGNSLDNSLTGGNQDDFLNGGEGNNELHGEGGIDTDTAATAVVGGVENQSGTWDSIEKPEALPEETEEPPVVTEEPPVVTETPTPPSEEDPGVGVGGQGLIPVTGGLIKLGCGSNTFTLPNGDKVTISGLCGDYWISLESLGSNLPGNLPDGKTMLSGIAVQVYQGTSEFDMTLAQPLPQGVGITFSFLLHDQKSDLASLLWGASGNWSDLGGGQVNGDYFDVSSNQNGTVALVK